MHLACSALFELQFSFLAKDVFQKWYDFVVLCVVESSSPPKKDIPNLKWKDIMSLIDLPENRNKGIIKRIGGIKNQILKLGGMNVVVFTTVVFVVAHLCDL